MNKAVVLLSSGLDSSVNLYAAMNAGFEVSAVTFDYGQRASKKEILCASKICEKLNISHEIIDLKFIKKFGTSSLIDENRVIPTKDEVQIDNFNTSEKTAKSVWVPNRNGIFLNVAAGVAESIGATWVVPGFNKEEASTFPDNSFEFMKRLEHSFELSTANCVKVKCFTVDMDKTEIVKLGKKLNVDWTLIWPCYFDGEKWCRECESCQRSLRAFKNVCIEV